MLSATSLFWPSSMVSRPGGAPYHGCTLSLKVSPGKTAGTSHATSSLTSVAQWYVLTESGRRSSLPTHPQPQEKETQTVMEINTVKSYKSES